MAAEKFSLLIDSQTRGTAEIEKLSAALNKVTEAALKSNKQTEESAKRTTSTVQSQFASIKQVIQSPLEAAGDAAESFALSFGKVGLIGAGVTTAFTAIGGASMALVSQVGDAAERMTNFADRTGLTVNQVDRLQAMARIAGVSVDGLEGQARILADTLSDAGGAGAKAEIALRQLGINARDSAGNMREMGPVLIEVLQGLSRVERQADRVTLGTQVLGRGAGELQPLIKNFRELEETAKQLGFGFDEGVIRKLGEAGDEMDKLGLQWDLLKRKLAVPATAVVEITTKGIGFIGDFARGARTGSAGRFAGPPEQGPSIPRPGAPGGPETLLPGLNAQVADQASRDAALKLYLDARQRTELGQKERLAKIEADIIAKDAALRANLSLEARKGLEKQIADLRAEKTAIEAAHKATEERNAALKKLEDLQRELRGDKTPLEKQTERVQKQIAEQKRLTEAIPAMLEYATNVRRGTALTQQLLGQLPDFRGQLMVNTGDIAEANAGRTAAEAAQAKARIAGISTRETADQERSLRLLEEQVSLEERRIELMTGPGGELDAAKQIRDLRLTSLEEQIRLGRSVRDVEMEAARVRKEFELEILSIRKQQREEGRRTAESLFDAAVAGGQGIRSFVTSTALSIPRKIAGNVGAEMGNLTGRFSLGLGGLPGRLLAGTPFGADPLKAAGDVQMSAAQIQLQAATIQANAAKGTVFSGATGVSGIFSALSGTGAGSLPSFGASQGARNLGLISMLSGMPLTFGGGGGGGLPSFGESQGARNLGLISTMYGVPLAAGTGAGSLPSFGASQGTRNLGLISSLYGVPVKTSPGFGLSQGVGAAGAVAAGAFGAYSGFKAGGVQGALTGTSSLAGTAAALLPLMGVSGPAAPIIGAIALGLGLTAAFMGDPKKRRAEQIESSLRGRQYSEPEPVSISEDVYGRALYEDFRGGIRPSGRTVVIQTINNVSAVDGASVAQFFEDHHEELGRGMYKAIVSGTEAVPAMARELGLA